MPRKLSEDVLVTVARMYYEQGKNQSEIAQIMDVSQAKVSRMLARARKMGIIRISVARFELRHAELESRLQKLFRMRTVVVAKTNPAASKAQRRGILGHVAGPVVGEIINDARWIGLAGGRTLSQVLRWVQCQRPIAEGVVELMGSVNAVAGPNDATELARKLATRIHAPLHALRTPVVLSDPDVREMMMRQAQLQQVFELHKRIDLALVGVGSLESSMFIDPGIISESELEILRRASAVGEVCGRFFGNRGVECDTDLKDRVVSIPLLTLRDIPQVIGIAVGEDRARPIVAALRGGFINSLITDEQTAEAILELHIAA